jgi:hypothetical protein
MTTSRASSARSAHPLQFKSVAIAHLKQQIDADRTSIKKQHHQMTDLEDELKLSRALITNWPDSLPADIIFGDLCHSRSLWWIAVMCWGGLRWIATRWGKIYRRSRQNASEVCGESRLFPVKVCGESQKAARGVGWESRKGTVCGSRSRPSFFALRNDHVFHPPV